MAGSALGQRPAGSSEKKLVGIVVATVGASKVKFTLVEGQGKEFADGSDSITVALKDLPKVPVFTPKEGDTPSPQNGKQFRIRMNRDGDEIEAITPVSGLFTAQLVDLGPRPSQDADPEPQEKRFEKDGKTNTHMEFFAVYKIVDGVYKGVQMPAYYLHYKFEGDEEGNTRYAGNFENKKATRLFQLADWMKLHGLDSKPIKWPKNGNILPELLLRGTNNPVYVSLVVKDGWIKELLTYEGQPEFAVDAEDHESLDNGDDVDNEFPQPASKMLNVSKSKRVAKPADDEEELD